MITSTKLAEISQLQKMLKYVFGILPMAAGADKFLNLLTQWEKYLPPTLQDTLPFSPSVVMLIVGIIEIVAGMIVLTKTEIGAYIVAAWLGLIALGLIVSGHHLDVAVRDLVMGITAFVLGRLTGILTHRSIVS